MFSAKPNLISRVVVLVLVLAAVAYEPAGPVRANNNPCGDVINSPEPPTDEPEPTIGGTVSEPGSGAVVGAQLKVYKCVAGEATYVETLTTDQSGEYESGALTPGYYHYAAVEMSGPLEGMTPADGTQNPSDAVGLGPDATIDFEFE